MESLSTGIKHISNVLISLSAIIWLSACATTSYETEEMLIKSSELSKLSKAVESYVRYENYPEDISDKELLINATIHDPALLAPFTSYTLKVKRESMHSAVMVCNADGSMALLEDAGCTSKLDLPHWESNEHPVCNFTLKLSDVCAAGRDKSTDGSLSQK